MAGGRRTRDHFESLTQRIDWAQGWQRRHRCCRDNPWMPLTLPLLLSSSRSARWDSPTHHLDDNGGLGLDNIVDVMFMLSS